MCAKMMSKRMFNTIFCIFEKGNLSGEKKDFPYAICNTLNEVAGKTKIIQQIHPFKLLNLRLNYFYRNGIEHVNSNLSGGWEVQQ
jgi:hypothetical protein